MRTIKTLSTIIFIAMIISFCFFLWGAYIYSCGKYTIGGFFMLLYGSYTIHFLRVFAFEFIPCRKSSPELGTWHKTNIGKLYWTGKDVWICRNKTHDSKEVDWKKCDPIWYNEKNLKP